MSNLALIPCRKETSVLPSEELPLACIASAQGTADDASLGNLSEASEVSILACALSEYKARIYIDDIAIWESEEMVEHFPLVTMRRIRLRWTHSSRAWIRLELRKYDDESYDENAFNSFYLEYVAAFHKIEQAMLRKQRTKTLTVALKKLSRVKAPTAEVTLLQTLPLAASHPTEAPSLVFELVRNHPQVWMTLQA